MEGCAQTICNYYTDLYKGFNAKDYYKTFYQ